MSLQSIDERRDEFAKCFGHHFVGLIGNHREVNSADGKVTDRVKTFRISGFVCSIDEDWYFVTAGHALKIIEDYLKLEGAAVGAVHLIDNFGAKDKTDDTAIPFSNAFEKVVVVHSEIDSLDFGVIPLDKNKKQLLTSNGIVAVDANHVHEQLTRTYSSYAVLGLPTEVNQELATESDSMINVPSTFIVLVATSEGVIDEIRAQYENWLVLRLIDQDVIDSIIGMSGGPVLGFQFNDDGSIRYWVVGIQSSWVKARRHTIVCPTLKFWPAMQSAINQVR